MQKSRYKKFDFQKMGKYRSETRQAREEKLTIILLRKPAVICKVFLQFANICEKDHRKWQLFRQKLLTKIP